MSEYQRAVPVLQVANVETSLRWYVDVLGFKPDTFPSSPPYSFAILRRDGAEIMLQCADKPRLASSSERQFDPRVSMVGLSKGCRNGSARRCCRG